jgi:dephospho-CoA kinase
VVLAWPGMVPVWAKEITRRALRLPGVGQEHSRNRMSGPQGTVVLGVLGGVASGKTLISKQLQELGAEVLDADRAGHAVLLEPDVEAAARTRWGPKIFGPDGHIERKKLGAIVFGPSAEARRELEYLEKLTHPRIGALLRRQAVEASQRGTRVLVLDAAVMLKAGWQEFCNKTIFVDAPREVRLARARQRGWTDEGFAAREAAQESLEEKRRWADVTIENSGSVAATRAQVEQLWHTLAP